jgi:hypothetical protein
VGIGIRENLSRTHLTHVQHYCRIWNRTKNYKIQNRGIRYSSCGHTVDGHISEKANIDISILKGIVSRDTCIN